MYGRTDGWSRDCCITAGVSRIDGLPYFLSNGARWWALPTGSAIIVYVEDDTFGEEGRLPFVKEN